MEGFRPGRVLLGMTLEAGIRPGWKEPRLYTGASLEWKGRVEMIGKLLKWSENIGRQYNSINLKLG